VGGAGSVGDDTAAILGRSLPTNPGDPPQANKDPSITDRDAETAIWTYNRADDSLTARWVNYVGQHPASTMAYITFLTNGNKFYLTNIRISPPNAYPAVCFILTSLNDVRLQCNTAIPVYQHKRRVCHYWRVEATSTVEYSSFTATSITSLLFQSTSFSRRI